MSGRETARGPGTEPLALLVIVGWAIPGRSLMDEGRSHSPGQVRLWPVQSAEQLQLNTHTLRYRAACVFTLCSPFD
jgi:hypothetical protein